MLFFIAMDPAKILTMMEELINDINPLETKHRPRPTLAEIDAFRQVVERMKKDKRIIILGKEKLKSINKQVGDRLTLTGINYQDINLEVEIAGVFPSGKYEDTCVMHFDYLNDSIAAYPQAHGGQKHPLADKSLNLVWLKVKGPKAYHRIAQQIEASTQFRDPSVKIETLSAAIAASLDRLQSLIWGLKYLISPAILLTMTLVVANAISISARERRAELAVLKVFGFLPGHLLLLVLGEAVVIGVVGGGLSSTLSFVGLNYVLPRLGESGNSLFVPTAALWWGPILGAGTAVLGSIVPAWGACRVRVAEVFARVG
jgi:putative ABC transport system permease protein